jgi:hypothetical protein
MIVRVVVRTWGFVVARGLRRLAGLGVGCQLKNQVLTSDDSGVG